MSAQSGSIKTGARRRLQLHGGCLVAGSGVSSTTAGAKLQPEPQKPGALTQLLPRFSVSQRSTAPLCMQAWGWGWAGVSFKLTYLLCGGRFFLFFFFAFSSLQLHTEDPLLCRLCPSPPLLPHPSPRKLLKPSTQKSKRINHHLPCHAHATLSQAAAGCMHTCWRSTDVSRPSKPPGRLRVDAGMADAMCGRTEAFLPRLETARLSPPPPPLTWFVLVLFPPEHQNHARELVRKADLSQWDALVIMSGDGLLFEVGSAFSDDQ